ncbi:glycosyl hydrolase family 79 C-terminal domain-containing protein [Kribbella sp. NPDC048928]|uniref:glycosyl hydrolase family 79 C-terminal domain-containing protein n=1 Tax=Kribbella sp. NPDC048928 TaxID=3364111 RepID=UPI00371B9F52
MRTVRAVCSVVATVSLVTAAALPAGALPAGAVPAGPDGAGTPVSLSATVDGRNAVLPSDLQGFSVESADLAHGFLTSRLLARRLKTLGPHGVIRIGGYSMDLVWPAFGAWAGAPAPAEAIGGTVDQSDLDKLAQLVRDSGWKVSLGLPLKKLIDPAKIKDPTKDPSPAVTLDQAVAEVRAAHATLGRGLVAVEVGNEYDNVTTLTASEMWSEMKRFQAAINVALPHAGIKVIGPSANTAVTNTRLEDFMTAVTTDTQTTSGRVLEEISSHLYPGSHCGSSTTTIAALLSTAKYQQVQGKLDGITELGSQLRHPVPMTINESNSASCSGMPGVSDSYAMSLWSLDYLLQTGRAGLDRLQFHTNTAAICGDFKARTSPDYPISYRYYGAFCAPDQQHLDAEQLAASPLYYGLWAFHQVPVGRYLDLDVPQDQLGAVRAYAVQGRDGKVTLVLINLQDPAAAESTTQDVTVQLPGRFARGTAVTLTSADAAGLASLDSSAITLGGQQVDPSGAVTGHRTSKPVAVAGSRATVNVAPGTAQIVTLVR